MISLPNNSTHRVLPGRSLTCVIATLLSYGSNVAFAQSAAPSAAAPSTSAALSTSGSAVPAPPVTPVPPLQSNAPTPSAGAVPGDAPASDPDALQPPKLMNVVQPEYPAAAQTQGIAATVVLTIDIDVNGHVEAASVAQGAEATGLGFDEAALEAAKRLLFEPARERGQAIPVRIEYRFRFVPQAVQQTPANAPSAPTQELKAESPAAPLPTAPKGQLSGTLKERGTRLPLAGVKVTVFRGEGADAEGFETETDVEGKFRINNLNVGQWRLLADPEGYYPLRTTEEVRLDSRTDVTYVIERGAYNPYDVDVDTKRIQREVNHISIDARQAERVPGTFGDVLAVVKNFPGVARTSGGPFGGGLVIRGSAPKDSQIMVGNINVPLLYHFGDLRSVLPSGMIEKINFYPGNFSVQYGRATGGVVDVGLKDLNRKQFGGYADVNVFDASLYLEAPLTDKLSVAIAGRRSYIDTVLNAVLPGGGSSIVAPRYYDAQALVSYRPSAEHLLKAFFFLSDDKFEILFKDPVAVDAKTVITDIGLKTNFYRGMAEYKYVPNAHFDNELKLSFGRDKNAFNLGSIGTDVLLYQGQVRDTARYVFGDKLALRGGVDYLYQRRRVNANLPQLPREGDSNAEFDLSKTFSTSEVHSYHSLAGFAELDVKPWQGALVVPGVRFDHFTRTGKSAFSPRVVLRQAINSEWLVKGGVGLFQQEPTFDETDKGGGNPNLKLEKAIHYSAGFEYKPLPFLSFDVTGFYKSLYDVVGRTDELTTNNGETTPLNFNNGTTGRVIGLELLARHELNKNLYAWVAYTLSKSDRKDAGSTTRRLFDYDQTHILTLLGSYRLPRNWEIGARFRYVTGNLYTPTTGAVYNADKDEYAEISGRVNSARVNAFHQLDIRIDKRWVYQSWMLNAYLDIQNVYNQPNADNLQYNYDFSKSKPQTGLPVIPILGLRGEF